MKFDVVLLDMDGVLLLGSEPIDGAPATIAWLREQEIPLRVVTNSTHTTASGFAKQLNDAGIRVEAHEIVTAVVGTASYLRMHHRGATVFLLSDGDPEEDLAGITLVEEGADVVVVGGASDLFTYGAVNRAFRMLMDGAALVAMHRNLYWRSEDAWHLDGGAYLRLLEDAANTQAVVCGKPSTTFFEAALAGTGAAPDRALMMGDDIRNDVLAAQHAGMTGVLVRTGKFRQDDLEAGEPNHVIDGVGDLPALLESLLEA
ncbi:MAG: HAD-IIA family hydrolase [Actinomycetota bacterium]